METVKIVEKPIKLKPTPCERCPRGEAGNFSCRCVLWKEWFRESWRAVQDKYGVQRKDIL